MAIDINSEIKESSEDSYEGQFSTITTVKDKDGKEIQMPSLVKSFFDVFKKWLEKYKDKRVCIKITTIEGTNDETKIESHDTKEESITIEGKPE